MSDHLSWLLTTSQEDAASSSASIDAPKDTTHDAACDETLGLKKGQGEKINDKNVSVDLTPKTDNIEVQGESARSEESANPTNELDISSNSETQGAKISVESEDANKDLAGVITDVSKTETAKVNAAGAVETPKKDEPGLKPTEEVDVTTKDKPSTEDASSEEQEDGEKPTEAADKPGRGMTVPVTHFEEAQTYASADENAASTDQVVPEDGAAAEAGADDAAIAGSEEPLENTEPTLAEGTPVEEAAGDVPADISEPEPEVNPVEEAQAYLNDTGEAIDRIEKVDAALEAFHRVLSSATDGGRLPVDPNLARAVYVGLEAFNDSWLTAALPSVEDFSNPAGCWTVSTELFDNLKGKMSDTAAMTANALRKLWDWLMDLWNALTADTAELKEKLQSLSARSAAIKTANNNAMPLKGARRLYVGNFFVGNTPKPIMDIAQVGMAFLGNYPKMMSRTLDQVTQQVGREFNRSSDAAAAFGVLVQTFVDNFKPEGLGLKPASNAEIPTAFADYPKVAKSVTLPGNKAMYAGLQERAVKGVDKATGEQLAMTNSMNKIFKVSFETVPGDFQSQEESVKAPDTHTLNTMIKALDQLVGNISDFSQAKAELQRCKDKLLKATSNISQQAGLNAGSFLLNGYSRALGNNMALPAGNYLGYVHSIVKVYLAVLTAFVAHHEAGNDSEVREPQTFEG